MRQYLHELDNTPSGAKFARERHLDENPGVTVIIGYNYMIGYFMDITKPVTRPVPHLRLVVNNG